MSSIGILQLIISERGVLGNPVPVEQSGGWAVHFILYTILLECRRFIDVR